MPCDRHRSAIQELADGTLGPIRRAELELHLEVCDACRAFAADIQQIRETARSLDRLAPPERIWLQIAGRLRQEGRIAEPAPARPGRGRTALLAIAAALVLAVGTSLYLLTRDNTAAPPVAAPVAGTAQPAGSGAASAETVQSIATELQLAEQHFQNAIAGLEKAARSDDGALDPQTAAMLQKSLNVIDQAIAESRAAVRSEPQSASARDSLLDALKRKVVLLQDTIALMNQMRKGDAAGAAQIVEGTNKS
jgi:anti-sigma factor RsiW